MNSKFVSLAPKFFVGAVFFNSLVSCAVLNPRPDHCNSSAAFQLGYSDASQGHSDKPGLQRAQRCSEYEYKDNPYSANLFTKDYQGGFEKRKLELCQVNQFSSRGTEDGTLGSYKFDSRKELQLCFTDDRSQFKRFKKAYDVEYARAFCAVERVERSANARVEGFQSKDLSILDTHCKSNASQYQDLVKAYTRKYEETLAKNCTSNRFYALGLDDAKEKHQQGTAMVYSEACPASVSRGDLLSAYNSGYITAKTEIQQQEQLELERKRIAQEQEMREREMRLREEAIRNEQRIREEAIRNEQRIREEELDLKRKQIEQEWMSKSRERTYDSEWSCNLRKTIGPVKATVDFNQCKDTTQRWACYRDVTEVCENDTSGHLSRSRTIKHFTGQCTSTPSQCI